MKTDQKGQGKEKGTGKEKGDILDIPPKYISVISM